MEKILQIRHNLPHLKAIIQYDGTPNQKDVLSVSYFVYDIKSIIKSYLIIIFILQWNDLIKIGEAESDDKLNEVLKKIAVNQCCTLVFTVGKVNFV